MIKVITTEDGSPSIYVEELDETYHSKKGAVTEAEHIYINAGLKHLIQNGITDINIFEMGFGTGLNTILTYKEWQKHPNLKINYTTIEKYPLAKQITDTLVYNGITTGNLATVFSKLHTTKWDTNIPLANGFTFYKAHADVHTYNIGTHKYNCVYYDAFAPTKQSDVWQYDVLSKICNAMQQGGVLVTYSASGQLKRNLKQLGFLVEILPGPPGKKQITRAFKTAD